MPLYLLQVQKVVRNFCDFILKGCLVGTLHLSLKVDFVDSLAKLEESLVLDPA